MGNISSDNQPNSNLTYDSSSSHHKTPFEIFTIIPEPNVIFYHSTSPPNPPKSLQYESSKNADSFTVTINNSINDTNLCEIANKPSNKNNNYNNRNYSPKFSRRKIFEKELIELDMKTFLNLPRKMHLSQKINVNGWERQKKHQNMYNKDITKLKCNDKKNFHTLFIYDWDDTLLCTSYLSPHGFFNDNIHFTQRDRFMISTAEELVYNILLNSIQKGHVYIITNSGPGWVEYSCEKFYPSVVPLLENIKIISARAEFEMKYPGDSKMWKMMAFDKMKKNYNKEHIKNIICIGDSFIEIEAGHMLTNKFEKAVVKTVKFREKVSIEEMNKQLKLISEQFHKIYSYEKNLKIRVEKKKKSD